MPVSSFLDMQNAVRELTNSLSPNQLSAPALRNWINQFYVFDLPRIIRPDDLRVNINLLLNAYQQAYPMAQFNAPNPITNPPVNNVYPAMTNLNTWITSIYPPVYIGGRVAMYTQDQAQFWGLNPKNQQATQFGAGTGLPMVITVTFPNQPITPGQVTFSSQDINFNSIGRRDTGFGTFVDQNNNLVAGTINYVTGVVTGLDMGTPGVLVPIFGYAFAYNPSWPEMMMLFNNTLYFYPVPDQAYQVTFAADITVSDLVLDTDQPLQPEWWQFIVYGAAIKILEFRLRKSEADELRPAFEEQKDFVNRKLITSQSTNRTQTIYCAQDSIVPFLNQSFSNQG